MCADNNKIKVLFICLGNICRSPMAHFVFKHLAKQRGVEDKWHIDSAAIGGWHVGGPGDYRMIDILKKNNIEVNHTVRQIVKSDFNEFDVIFGMDEENIRSLKKMAPKDCKARIELLGKHDPEGKLIIRDPYYDSDLKGFEEVYRQCVRCSNAILDAGQC